jgi:phosphate-selective porin OprO/OprP
MLVVGNPTGKDCQAAESQRSSVNEAVPSSSEGPQKLKREGSAIVKTNSIATGEAVPDKKKSFQFNSEWQGWNGLQIEISQKTTIPHPFSDLTEVMEGTNANRVIHLEELKMSGNIGAKFAVDAATFVTSKQFEGFDSGIELRRARVYAKGDCLLVLPVSYELEVGYIPNEFYIENSYLSFKDIAWIGELKMGQFQPPMSMEMITSSRDLRFMEPAGPVQALASGTSVGIQIGQPILAQRMTWRMGLFTHGVGTDYGDASEDYARTITRVTGLPFWTETEDGSTRALHLGLSASAQYSGNRVIRYRTRPESHLAPYVIDTGDIAAEDALTVGTEIAYINGPFCIQGEYLHSWVGEKNGRIPTFNGLYTSASWFITGESRPYDRYEGVFGRVIPKHNFNFGRDGWGAWELAGRWSYVDLNSDEIHGGRLGMLMTGVNWYLHSHLKWRFDYGFGRVQNHTPDGNVNVFQTRVEVDF